MELTKKSKKTIVDISSLFGVKPNLIKTIFEYLGHNAILEVARNSNEGVAKITIPYLGTLSIKVDEDNNLVTNKNNNLIVNYKTEFKLETDFEETISKIFLKDDSIEKKLYEELNRIMYKELSDD